MNDAHRTPVRASRRRAIRNLAALMAGSPLVSLVDANGDPVEAAQTPPAGQAGAQGGGGQGGGRQGGAPRGDRPPVISLPVYRDEIMKVINLHEFEDAAKKALSVAAYDYVAAGAGDELTLKANREAFSHYWVRRKIMVDTSNIDTSFELFGKTYDHPILLGPGGGKNIVAADGERLSALAAKKTKAIMVGGQMPMLAEMGKKGGARRSAKERSRRPWTSRKDPRMPARRPCASRSTIRTPPPATGPAAISGIRSGRAATSTARRSSASGSRPACSIPTRRT